MFFMNGILAFEISLLGNDSFLSGSFFVAFALAAATAVAVAIAITVAIAIAITITITITITAAAAGAEHLLGPCNDTITVGSSQIHNVGNGSQGDTDFYDNFQSFHFFTSG
jgi:hypothetical protein